STRHGEPPTRARTPSLPAAPGTAGARRGRQRRANGPRDAGTRTGPSRPVGRPARCGRTGAVRDRGSGRSPRSAQPRGGYARVGPARVALLVGEVRLGPDVLPQLRARSMQVGPSVPAAVTSQRVPGAPGTAFAPRARRRFGPARAARDP